MLIEKRNFLQGLNGDIAQRLLGDGEMLNLMNGRVAVSEHGRMGRVENIPGTTAITDNVHSPYGVDHTIGSAVDEGRMRVFKFNYNSFGFHWISCIDFSTTTPTTYAVLYDTQVVGGLNFSKSYRIDRNAKVSGNLLYWTDNLNPPRRINIEAGIKTNTPGYAGTVAAYSYPMNQSVITWIRRPYGMAVTATKSVDAGFDENYVKDFSGQFACRLIYRDGEYSVISIPSAMVNYNSGTDTFNYVAIVFPFAETFDQDVQIIQLVVRNDNSPNYFVIKEWDKANTNDRNEIIAHNAGSVNLSFNFYNDKTGIAVGSPDSVKPFDSIGLTVKTIEYADNRMFHANYVKGYNTPTTTSLTGTVSLSGSNPTQAQSLKANSSYQISIQFRDNESRRSFIVTNDSCIINVPDRVYLNSPNASIAWSVSNLLATTEIPDWAYYYDILVTKNLRTRFFVSCLGELQYAIKNADGTFSYQSNYTGSVYAIGLNPTFLTALGAGYLADLSDKYYLYLSNTSTVFDGTILGQDGNYIFLSPQDLGTLNPMPGCVFEIYTPYKPSENEIFYTTGQTYKVTNPTTGSRSYSTTSGTISGDITRWGNSIFSGFESMSPNWDVWRNWTMFYGATNLFSQLGQVNKTNFISWSNVRIIGAQTNGLSTFDAGDEKPLPENMGEINKLQLTEKVSDLGQGDIMLAICTSETASLYLGEVQVQGASTTAFVSQTSNVIGSVNVLNGSLGTTMPSSVIPYLGKVFWYDLLNGCIVQYSQAGLEQVSRYNMSRFFKRYAKEYLESNSNNLDNINGFHHISSAIDPFYKEVVFILPGLIYSNYADTLPSYSSVPSYLTDIINRFDVYTKLAQSVAFRYEENKWGSVYEWLPEWTEYLADKLIAFKNGLTHTHNTNTTNWNTFYGTEYPIRLCITGNLNSSMLKDLNNISVESSVAPTGTVALTEIPNQQITDLELTDYTDQQGVYYAVFFRDRLSPNASGTADQKLYTGDQLTDFAIFVMIEMQQYEGLEWVQFINIGYNQSKGQRQIVDVINK